MVPDVALVPEVPDVLPTPTPICFVTTITEGAAGAAYGTDLDGLAVN